MRREEKIVAPGVISVDLKTQVVIEKNKPVIVGVVFVHVHVVHKLAGDMDFPVLAPPDPDAEIEVGWIQLVV